MLDTTDRCRWLLEQKHLWPDVKAIVKKAVKEGIYSRTHPHAERGIRMLAKRLKWKEEKNDGHE